MLKQACFSCSGNSYNVLANRINNNPDIVFLTQKLNKNLRSSIKTFEQITYELSEIYKEIREESYDTNIRETEFRCCKTLSEKKIRYMRAVNLNVYALEHIIENKKYFDKSENTKKELLEYMNMIEQYDQNMVGIVSTGKDLKPTKNLFLKISKTFRI